MVFLDMKKNIFLYVFSMIVIIVVVTIYHNFLINENFLSGVTSKNLIVVNNYNTPKEKLFKAISDIEKYPMILPNNVKSIEIIERIEYESGIIVTKVKAKLVAKGILQEMAIEHVIIPNERIELIVLDGDARHTKIVIEFNEIDGKTRIAASAELILRGILEPFIHPAEQVLKADMIRIMNEFNFYAKNNL